jgi:hypothetical protein
MSRRARLPSVASPCKGEDEGEGPYTARYRARFRIPPPLRNPSARMTPTSPHSSISSPSYAELTINFGAFSGRLISS